MTTTERARFALFPAVLSVSSSAIFVRLASAPPLATAFWRAAVAGSALAAVFLLPYFRQQWRVVSWKRIGTIAAATVVISLHQICFISSLQHTSIAAATFLTSTQPVFTALLGGVLIREHVSVRSLVAMGGALGGMALITLAQPSESALLGNVLAVIAALLASLYTLAARRLRQSTPLLPYMLTVNVSASVFLGILALLFGIDLVGYSARSWTGLILLGLIPTLIGHSLLTYAVGHLRAFVVNASILGEPVGATLLGALFLSEIPSLTTLAGGAVIIACILGIVMEKQDRPLASDG